jgi:hypothetical protein
MMGWISWTVIPLQLTQAVHELARLPNALGPGSNVVASTWSP